MSARSPPRHGLVGAGLRRDRRSARAPVSRSSASSALGFLADCDRPQADDDAVLRDVPHPDPGGLSVGAVRCGVAALRRRPIFGFFTGGIWAWAPVWLPELFPTRMRGTAVAFCFNAPRWISCVGPLIAGTLDRRLGGFGPAATIVGMFFILGVVAAPFLPETNGKPLPHALWRNGSRRSASAGGRRSPATRRCRCRCAPPRRPAPTGSAPSRMPGQRPDQRRAGAAAAMRDDRRWRACQHRGERVDIGARQGRRRQRDVVIGDAARFGDSGAPRRPELAGVFAVGAVVDDGVARRPRRAPRYRRGRARRRR